MIVNGWPLSIEVSLDIYRLNIYQSIIIVAQTQKTLDTKNNGEGSLQKREVHMNIIQIQMGTGFSLQHITTKSQLGQQQSVGMVLIVLVEVEEVLALIMEELLYGCK